MTINRKQPGNQLEWTQKKTSSAHGGSSIRNNNTNFDRATLDIGTVLVLRTDKPNKKAPFDNLRGNILDYFVKEFDNKKDVVDIVKTMTDPKIKFK